MKKKRKIATSESRGQHTDEVPTRVGQSEGAVATDPGIEVIRIWMSECLFEDYGFNKFIEEGPQEVEAQGEQMLVHPEAEVWFGGEREAMVRLTVEIKPESQPSFRTKVGYVGHYRCQSSSVMTIEEFAWTNGIAYLVPFLREKIATLTQSSLYPAFYLQPFNVDSLTESL